MTRLDGIAKRLDGHTGVRDERVQRLRWRVVSQKLSLRTPLIGSADPRRDRIAKSRVSKQLLKSRRFLPAMVAFAIRVIARLDCIAGVNAPLHKQVKMRGRIRRGSPFVCRHVVSWSLVCPRRLARHSTFLQKRLSSPCHKWLSQYCAQSLDLFRRK